MHDLRLLETEQEKLGKLIELRQKIEFGGELEALRESVKEMLDIMIGDLKRLVSLMD